MAIIKLRLVGPLFEQCCMKNHLILQTIQNMMVARGWKLLGSGIKTKCVDTATPNEQLANESQKQPLKNFECKIYSSFMDNMWGVYLAHTSVNIKPTDVQPITWINFDVKFIVKKICFKKSLNLIIMY